jgi:hypothetical protein
MRPPRLRFTIRSLMIAVAVVAGLMVLPREWVVLAVVFSIPSLPLTGAVWLASRGHRRPAAVCFGILAVLANGLYAVLCITPDCYLDILLVMAWFVIVLPAVGGVGIAWASLSTREGAAPRRSARVAWLAVIGLTAMPLFTIMTDWSLHLAFAVARPALDRLADQVTAGRTVGFPLWAGPFRVAAAAVDPVSGNVGLMIDPDPNGPTGFVRVESGIPGDGRGPIVGSDLNLGLGGGWWYREED